MELSVTASKIENLDSRMREARSICIVTHFHPDGDALGSTTALQAYIRDRIGGRPEIVLSSPAADNLTFLLPEGVVDAQADPIEAKRVIADADLIIGLDFNDFSRTESLCEALSSSKAFKVLIDHHLNPSVQDFDLVFSDTQVSSACELLFNILVPMPGIDGDAAKLPAESARALMAGMTTDTNNFANSVFPGTLKMASALLAAGVDREDILDRIYRKHRENRLRALGYLLGENLTITAFGVAYMIIDSSLAERFDLQEGQTEGFVNEPLAIGRVAMSILLKEDGDHFRVSIRSKRGVSANRLAATCFHGGGHEQAAGGKLFWPQDIESKSDAASYVEEVTARFMQNEHAANE